MLSRINLNIHFLFLIRSYKGLTPWLQDTTRGTHTKYASTLIHCAAFTGRVMNCTPSNNIVCPTAADFLYDRLGNADPQESTEIAASIAFAIGLAAFNMILYLFPMPRCVRQKFKDN